MPFFNHAIETLRRSEIEEMQLKLLRAQARRMYERSPFYHARMREVEVMPDDITRLDDVRRLPTTKKTDLRDNYPDKLFVPPLEKIVRYHVSSGTTGQPTVVAYTRNDIEMWSESLARAFASTGMGESDVIQVANGYGLFSGGMGMHYAGEKLGATVLPAGTGNTRRQVQFMMDLPVTCIACTPSYMLQIAEVAQSMGVSLQDDTRLERGILGAEPWSDSMKAKIEDEAGIKAYNCYGASELSGPLFTECEAQDGIHVWGDMALVEIIDPDTGEACADGEKGEMIVTMLQKEAMPLLRYRIGDMSSLSWDPCECGREHPRLMRLTGRVDDMMVIRGINVFPSQVEHLLYEVPEVGKNFQIVVDRVGNLDTMLIKVELEPEAFTDDILKLRHINRQVADGLKAVLNIKVEVQLVGPGTLPKGESEKASRVIDKRVM